MRKTDLFYSNMFDQFIKTCMNNVPIFKHLHNTVHSDGNTRTVSHDPYPCLFKLLGAFWLWLGSTQTCKITLFIFTYLHPKCGLLMCHKTKGMVLDFIWSKSVPPTLPFHLLFLSIPSFNLMSDEVTRSLFPIFPTTLVRKMVSFYVAYLLKESFGFSTSV